MDTNRTCMGSCFCGTVELSVEPGLHVNYAEAVLRIKDGLPKMKDLPKEMGGSGELVPE